MMKLVAATTVPTESVPQLEQLWRMRSTTSPAAPAAAKAAIAEVLTVTVPPLRVETPQVPFEPCVQPNLAPRLSAIEPPEVPSPKHPVILVPLMQSAGPLDVISPKLKRV